MHCQLRQTDVYRGDADLTQGDSAQGGTAGKVRTVVIGLGSGTGININSTEEEINMVAKNIREIILSL